MTVICCNKYVNIFRMVEIWLKMCNCYDNYKIAHVVYKHEYIKRHSLNISLFSQFAFTFQRKEMQPAQLGSLFLSNTTLLRNTATPSPKLSSVTCEELIYVRASFIIKSNTRSSESNIIVFIIVKSSFFQFWMKITQVYLFHHLNSCLHCCFQVTVLLVHQ